MYEEGDSTYLAGTNGDRARVVGSRQLASRVLLSGGTALDIQRDSTGTPILSVRGPGRATRLVPLDGLKDPFVPWWHRHVSPDGSRAFVFVHDSAGRGVVAVVDLDSGRVVVLDSVGTRAWFRGTSVFAWSADGRALYAQTSGLGAALGRIELGRDRLHLGRRRALLLPDLDRTALVTSVATSRNRAVLEMGHFAGRVLIGRVSSGAAQRRFSVEGLSTGSLVPMSADIALRQDRLYFVAAIDSAVDGLFEMALPSGAPRQVARLEGGGVGLRLSPDGSTAVVGSSTADSGFAPTLVDLRTGATRILPGWRAHTVMSQCHVFDWDPSGRAILAHSQERVGEQPRIIRMNAVSGVADTLRADSSAVILECPAVSPDGEWVALRYAGGRNRDGAGGRVGIYLLPLSGGPARALALTSEYPVGWLNARQLVAANLVADSTEIWLHNLDGTGSRLGAFPNARCEGAVLSPSRREIVCVTWRPTQDLWIADDFDPYFRPPAAPKRP